MKLKTKQKKVQFLQDSNKCIWFRCNKEQVYRIVLDTGFIMTTQNTSCCFFCNPKQNIKTEILCIHRHKKGTQNKFMLNGKFYGNAYLK